MPLHRAVLVALVCALGVSAQPASTKQRLKDIRELGKGGAESIPKLQGYLTDSDVSVRAEAVKAIVDIGGPRSVDALVQAARDNDPEIQIRATDGLVNFYLPGYIKKGFSGTLRRVGTAVQGRWTDTNDDIVDPFVKVPPDVVQAIGRLASGGSSLESRANAARAVGVLRGRSAGSDLVKALHSKDSLVIYEALIAMQKIRDESLGPQAEFLLRDLDDRVQVTALETMGLLRDKNAIPQIRDVVDKARNKKTRKAALSALAMLPDESNRKTYSMYLADKDEDLRAAAAEGIARLKNPSDLAQMKQLFESEKKMNARLAFAFAAASLGDNGLSEFSPLQYLVNTLNSKAWRGVAQAYLVELGRDPGVRRTLYSSLPNATKDEKIYLAQVLARSGDEETVKYLEALASDPDPEVSGEGLRALRTLKARL